MAVLTEERPLRQETPALTSPPTSKDRLQFLGLLVSHYILAAAGIITAYSQAKHSTGTWHIAVFWIAYFVAVIVTLAAGAFRYTTPRGHTLLLLAYGVFTFLPKFLMSMNGPAYFDEAGHWRQVNDIVASGHLTPDNTFLPIVKYYPGLETLTAGVHQVTRLSTWHSGQLVVLAAHCASLLVIYALARTLKLATVPSFLAALIFSLNPSFLYFDTQYSYESLGITLAFAALLCLLRARLAVTRRAATTYTTLGVLCAAATIVTHHISAMVMALCCLGAALLVRPVAGEESATGDVQRRAVRGAWLIAAVAVLGTAVWITGVAKPTESYLGPHLQQGVTQALDVLGISKPDAASGAAPVKRQLFGGPAPAPVYERAAAFAGPVLVLIAVLSALIVLWRRRPRGPDLRRTGVFIGLSLAYFVSLPLVLTPGGSETAHRSWVFCYVGVALTAATALSGAFASIVPRLGARGRLIGLGVGSLALVVIAMGNVGAGVNMFYRFPGPAMFGVDNRFRSAELTRLVQWSREHIPARSHVVTDRFTGQELTAYTTLYVPRPDQNPVYALYREGNRPSPVVAHTLRAGHFRYFVLDKRIMTQIPLQRFWPGYRGPISVDPAALSRLGHSKVATVVYHSPHYVIYRLRL